MEASAWPCAPGAPKPDISSVAALAQNSSSCQVDCVFGERESGIYLSTEMFQTVGNRRSGLAEEQNTQGERVGALIARGDAEIGFQQISELLPEPGIDYVGPLPAEVQRVTVFSAGLVVGGKQPEAAKALVKFLASEDAIDVIKKTALEPLATRTPRDGSL